MYNLKAFMVYGAMADNTVGVIAPLGELSTDSMTYAKEKGQYQNPQYDDPTLVSFLSEENNQTVPVSGAQANLALEIGQWIFDEAMGGNISGNASNFLRDLNAEFGDVINTTQVGSMLYNGSVWMPEWIVYGKTGTSSRIKIWFADEAFSNQYDEYTLEFITPLENIDNFFMSRADVVEKVAARTWTDIVETTERTKGENPYTVLRSDLFPWVDPDDREFELRTYWTTIIYGRGGNNLDIIKQELTEKILAESAYPRSRWAEIFPDLFTNTEFIITPLWSQYAIPNKTLQSGVYSPTVKIADSIALAKKTAQGLGYTSNWVSSHLQASFIPYKSLSFLVIGSPENRDGVVDFDQQFVDYISVSTGSTDFNRMSAATQNFVVFFNELIKAAEHMTDSSDIPTGISRIERNGVWYASAGHNSIQYLVVLRSYLETIDPPHVG